MARRADGNYSRLHENGYGDCLILRPSSCRTRCFRPCYSGLDCRPWLQVGYVGTAKNPHAGHRIAEGPHSSIGKRAPFVKGRQKGIGAPFVGFEVAENGRREAHSTS